jgi:amidohydrolase
MGGEDFGWYADVVPIALARLGTHGGGRSLDLHQGTFDVDESAIGVGVRLLARAALQALAAEAPPFPQPARQAGPAAEDNSSGHGASRPDATVPPGAEERQEPDDELLRPADRAGG